MQWVAPLSLDEAARQSHVKIDGVAAVVEGDDGAVPYDAEVQLNLKYFPND